MDRLARRATRRRRRCVGVGWQLADVPGIVHGIGHQEASVSACPLGPGSQSQRAHMAQQAQKTPTMSMTQTRSPLKPQA
jgi:hypothetical protein